MAAFRRTGRLVLGDLRWGRARALFEGYRVGDDETLAIMRAVYWATGELVDPHTAIGIAAGWDKKAGEVPLVALATAHPAKFPDAVERATGVRPPLPAPLADLLSRPERYDVLPNDLAAVQAHVRGQRLRGAA
jgi:threonine synthase